MKFSKTKFFSAFLAFLLVLSAFCFTPSSDVLLEAKAEGKLSLKAGASLVIDGVYLRNVKDKTTADDILACFSNSDAIVFNAEGNQSVGSSYVGTGGTVELHENGSKVDSLTVVVVGDLTGDGVIDSTDYLRIKSKFLGTIELSENNASAGDVDGNGEIDGTDYLKIKSYFLGFYELFPEIEPDVSDEVSEEASEIVSEPTSENESEEPSDEETSGIVSENRTNYALNKKYSFEGRGIYLSGKEDNGTLLTDNVIPDAEVAGQTLAFVGTGASNSVIINLENKYVDIDEIVILGVVVSGNRQYASVTIETSSNGVSYTALTGYSTSYENYSGYTNKYTYKLSSDVSAKYVKFTFVSENYVLTLGEIQVYGGNAPLAPEQPSQPSTPSENKLYIAKTGSIWSEYTNATYVMFPGQTVQGLYFYKLYAIYSDDVDGYIISAMEGSHCSYTQAVASNAIGICFSYDPHQPLGHAFGREQFKVWTTLRVGDILRPTGIDVANKTLDVTGSITNSNLVTNAYFTVEYAERNVPQTMYNGKTVVALGDSITANGGWTEAVSDIIGTTVINSGIGGDRVTEALGRFDSYVTAYNPDIVLVMFGINDCVQYSFNGQTKENYKNELLQVYNKCKNIGAKVVFMTPNDINTSGLNYDRYAAYGGLPVVYPQFIQAMKDVAAQVGAPCIDLYTPFVQAGTSSHLCDSVHPNTAGYDIFISEISKYLLENQATICG